MSLSTHVLDTAAGAPAGGVAVFLARRADDDRWDALATATTDRDGRAVLLEGTISPGTYRLLFATGERDRAAGRDPFFPEVAVAVAVSEPVARLHVPLLLSPFGYTTYRGS